MKFLIVTPSFNRIDYLNQTINSVVTQAGDFEIEYRVQDGGSEQPVISLLEGWKARILSGEFKPSCRALSFDYSVEPDSGMYDAINKGFARGAGDVMAWLNSDDAYLPNAFQAIADVFQKFEDVNWLIGEATACNKAGSTVAYSYAPPAFSQQFVERGYYRDDAPPFGWLSQDSIFWRSSLWADAGPLDARFKLVADFKLWQRFAARTDLVKLAVLLGGYRFHGNQLTGDSTAYPRELGTPATSPYRFRLWYKLCYRLRGLGRFATHQGMHPLSKLIFGVPYDALFGRVVRWDFKAQQWILKRLRILP